MKILNFRKKDNKKENKTSKKKLLFIDQPKKDISTEDKFKHNIYVETLKKIILECETPINIGLFGKWGVGKTTIINFLKKDIENSKTLNKKIKFLNSFDIWKYSGDSLRRELLFHINRELDYPKSHEDIEDRLYKITEVEDKYGFKFDVKEAIWLTISLIILYIIFSWLQKDLLAKTVFNLIFFPLLLHILLKTGSLITTIKRKKIISRIEHPEEFEKLFAEIIENSKIPFQKLVIPIDNLDRCRQNVVADLLGVIKTYLEKEKCIYLIACDDTAIKNHINRMRGEDIKSTIKCEDGEEFLRKFFQASITIPFYLEETLKKYMNDIFDEIELSVEIDKIDKELKIRIMQVIISAYTKNPRRIKRFLNNLSILYLIAKRREKDTDAIKNKLITKNLDFLAKITILREDWYDFYRWFERDNEVLNLIKTYIYKLNINDKDKEKKIRDFLDEENYPGLKKFLIATLSIGTDVKNIQPFFTLHQEIYQSVIEDESQIRIRDGDIDYFNNILKKANDNQKKSYERLFLKSAINYRYQKYNIYVFNVLNVIIYVYKNLINKKEIAEEVSKILIDAEFNKYLTKFNLDGVFDLLKDAPTSNKDNILDKYFDNIEESEVGERLFDLFILHNALISSSLIKKISIFIIENYNKNQAKMLTWIDKISNNEIAKKKIIDQEILKAVIESINVDRSVKSPIDENQKKVDLFWKLEDMSDIDVRSLFIIKMVQFIELSASNKLDDIKSFGLENILKIKTEDISDQASNSLFISFEKLYNGISNPEEKLKIIKAILKLLTSFYEQQRLDLIKKCVINYITSQDDIHFNNIMKNLNEYINEIPLQEEIIDHFYNRIIKEFHHKQEIVDSFVYLTIKCNKKEKSKNLIIELIKGPHYKLGLDSFQKHNKLFIQNDNDEIGSSIITKYQSLSSENWSPFIAILINDDINFSERFIDDLVENFLVHLLTNDENIREIGRNYYLKIKDKISNPKAKEIGQQLINKLEDIKEKVTEKTIPIIDVFIEEQERLEKDIIEKLIDILLYLTKESSSENVKEICFSSLVRINNLYGRKSLVLNRLLELSINSRPNKREKIIKTLIAFKNTKRTKNFWKKVKNYLEVLKKSDEESDRNIAEWALQQLKIRD
jgi:hypothetical protein